LIGAFQQGEKDAVSGNRDVSRFTRARSLEQVIIKSSDKRFFFCV